MDLLENALEVGREGIEDLGAQRLGDLVDVVEQLRRRTLGIVLQVDQTGVEGAQLLVWLQGRLARCMELRLGVFAAAVSGYIGANVRWLSYLRTSASASNST
jgi:hypothetical protein